MIKYIDLINEQNIERRVTLAKAIDMNELDESDRLHLFLDETNEDVIAALLTNKTYKPDIRILSGVGLWCFKRIVFSTTNHVQCGVVNPVIELLKLLSLDVNLLIGDEQYEHLSATLTLMEIKDNYSKEDIGVILHYMGVVVENIVRKLGVDDHCLAMDAIGMLFIDNMEKASVIEPIPHVLLVHMLNNYNSHVDSLKRHRSIVGSTHIEHTSQRLIRTRDEWCDGDVMLGLLSTYHDLIGDQNFPYFNRLASIEGYNTSLFISGVDKPSEQWKGLDKIFNLRIAMKNVHLPLFQSDQSRSIRDIRLSAIEALQKDPNFNDNLGLSYLWLVMAMKFYVNKIKYSSKVNRVLIQTRDCKPYASFKLDNSIYGTSMYCELIECDQMDNTMDRKPMSDYLKDAGFYVGGLSNMFSNLDECLDNDEVRYVSVSEYEVYKVGNIEVEYEVRKRVRDSFETFSHFFSLYENNVLLNVVEVETLDKSFSEIKNIVMRSTLDEG